MKFGFRDPSPPVSVEAWRRLARRRLPDMAWHYVESGADDRITQQANCSDFSRWRLRQRSLAGVAQPDMAAKMAGERLSMPLALAPTGASGISHWTGDIAATRAAERKGTRAVISTAASYTLEEIAVATEHNHWFQLYPFGDRGRVKRLMARAEAMGYTALFVTVDVPTLGNREAERTSGMAQPRIVTPGRLLNLLTRPVWLYNLLKHQRIAAAHYVERDPESGLTALEGVRRAITGAADDAARSADAQLRYMQSDLSWEDLAWMRDNWRGKVYVKGVLDADDAAQAVDQVGVDGVVVSNHGGRQLGRALSSIAALPAIAGRIGDRAEVFLDGGVRRGSDVITALCLGADGVFIGRPYLYGLAAAGEEGVASVLDIFQAEIRRDLTLMGCPGIAALDRSWLLDAS
ncbi:alpha-hydroxy acid oxidase [Haliea sp. E17]|uniref:alpha-hydroxy acid oxidase n=1 Tax=Haliea sp. E17 TaxID=3401576 RepID=UPI003AABFCE9